MRTGKLLDALTHYTGVEYVMEMISGSADDLPLWSTALPLWAGAGWLWLTLSPSGLVAIRGGRTDSTDDQPLLSPSYDIVVLDYRGTTEATPTFWTWLAATVEPEVLLVCAQHRGHLREQIMLAIPTLRASDWHAVEPGDEGSWRLRPAAQSMKIWCDNYLSPPYGLRSWLRQRVRRWRPFAHQIWCLPLWREAIR
ncbi:MAG: hypothetical protein ABI670_13000 [Chloroflexota bacterium]